MKSLDQLSIPEIMIFSSIKAARLCTLEDWKEEDVVRIPTYGLSVEKWIETDVSEKIRFHWPACLKG